MIFSPLKHFTKTLSNMTNLIIIILILLALIYFYRKKNLFSEPKNSPDTNELTQLKSLNHTLASFLQNEIGGQDLKEIRTKLNGKTLTELLEQNEDFETEIDTLTRTKKELESELLTQANSYRSLIKEKEGIIKRLESEIKQLKGGQNV